MSEQRNRARTAAVAEADSRLAKVIFFSTLFIGGVLLVSLAVPSILERFQG